MDRYCEHVALGLAKAMEDPAIWKEDPIAVPVQMVLCAAPVSVWPADYEKQVRKIAADLEFQRLKDAGHCVMLEKPKEFSTRLGEFLTKQGVLKR